MEATLARVKMLAWEHTLYGAFENSIGRISHVEAGPVF